MDTKAGSHTSSFRVELSPTSLDGTQEGELSQNSKSSANVRRAAQNRAAQRAFRQRKEQHIKDLESKSKQYDILFADNETLKRENNQLWGIVSELKSGKDIRNLIIPEKTAAIYAYGSQSEPRNTSSLEDIPSKDVSNSEIEARPSLDTYTTDSLKNFSNSPNNDSSQNADTFRPLINPHTNRQTISLNSMPNSISSFSPSSPNAFSYKSDNPSLVPSNPNFVTPSCGNQKSTNSLVPVDSPPAHTKQSYEELKPNALDIITKNREYMHTQFPPSEILTLGLGQTTEPPYLNEASLAFLQYGWQYDPSIRQEDYSSSYCEMIGMTPAEASFNDRVMDDLYSLLEICSTYDNRLVNVTSQCTQVSDSSDERRNQ
ncbi:hypothetical protein K7432_002900 [Basidiobolus ranarum]|uniref:BZIP domain-containing protein n=1 Tax=Basidiobolus ranarum TaxID=34480 RepID=A0ABR2X0U9_9FUNG